MKHLWSMRTKYGLWLRVELAVLWARMLAREITRDTYRRVRDAAKYSVRRITFLDEGPSGFRHDMNAFIENVKERLRKAGVPEDMVNRFHESVTSYDVEDPAFMLQLVRSLDLIIKELAKLRVALVTRAQEHKHTAMMGVTHGQWAEPITLGAKFVVYIEALERDLERLRTARGQLTVGKFAGIVGVYGNLTPQLEAAACRRLGQRPVLGTQIIHRDIHAQYMAALAILASNLEHVALNIWLMCQSCRGEAREPFRANQRGSSRAPHKKNPILGENLRGLAAAVRGFQSMAQEMIATADERDISQSCVERIAWPGATSIVHFMLVRLTSVIKGVEFFPDRMLVNIAASQGQTASGYVKDLLIRSGVEVLPFDGVDRPIYEWVQACAFAAWPNRHLKDEMIDRGLLGFVARYDLDQCFDIDWQLRNIDGIFERAGI